MSLLGLRRFQQVDVFAARPGGGNPLAVVIDADGMHADRMQALASWLNLAETTFLSPPDAAGADYRVRIFTTQKEIAFAGHPSIGSAHAALACGLATLQDGLLTQECPGGLLPIRCSGEAEARVLSVRVPRSRLVRFAGPDDGLLSAALGPARKGQLAPALVEGGRRWWLAELADETAVRQMRPDSGRVRQLALQTDSLGLCVFARCHGQPYDLVVRAFPLGVGIVEDPASGAANAAIAALLDETRALAGLGNEYTVSQGREMGHDARLELRLDADRQVWVGGRCQTVVEGQIAW